MPYQQNCTLAIRETKGDTGLTSHDQHSNNHKFKHPTRAQINQGSKSIAQQSSYYKAVPSLASLVPIGTSVPRVKQPLTQQQATRGSLVTINTEVKESTNQLNNKTKSARK
jgi:sensor c-di-GMP phosphodiesterase-like protein